MEGGRKVGRERGSSEKDKTDSPFSLQDVGIDQNINGGDINTTKPSITNKQKQPHLIIIELHNRTK